MLVDHYCMESRGVTVDKAILAVYKHGESSGSSTKREVPTINLDEEND